MGYTNLPPRCDALPASPIGLGLAALGRPAYINLGHDSDFADKSFAAMRRHAHTMLDAAYELGIRFFDTAASYGAGEQFLGEWLFQRGFHLDGVVAASKWGYVYTAGWQTNARRHEVKQHDLQTLDTSFVWSCLRLGQAMKLYQIHSATPESGVLKNNAVLDRLAQIRDDGRLIGLTVSGARQAELIDAAVAIERDGAPLFAAVQATWNLLEPSAGAALQRAKQAGRVVILKETLANGRLTERNTQPGFKQQRARLRQTADTLDCALDQLAFAAALSQPWADVALSGAATQAQLASHCAALKLACPADLPRQLADIAETPTEYWQTRAGLQWN